MMSQPIKQACRQMEIGCHERTQAPLACGLSVVLCCVTLFWFVLPFAFQPKLFLQDKGDLPEWMIPDGHSDLTGSVFEYKDVLGRTWYRLMKNAGPDSDTHFQVDAAAYPDGCCITWYSKDASTLRIRSSDNGIRRGLGKGFAGSQYPRILRREMISPKTLREGIHLGLMAPSPYSIFIRITPRRVAEDVWHEESGWRGLDSIWLLVASGLSILTWGMLCVGYVQTGKFRYAVTALCLAFLLGAVVFDRPYSGFAGQIDAGDDSYYLAYAQNLIVHGTFFKEPTAIAFGARRVSRNHGLPGTGLFLSPAAIAQSLLSGEPVRKPINLDGLRAMRLLSAGYSLAAMILLCASFHWVRPRSWNVVFATFLLWGTSLSKWTFQRCIFTHSIELAFLCSILFVLVWIWRKPAGPFWKGMVLGCCLGCAMLVRGEYLLAIPFVPFLLSRSVRQKRRFFWTLCAGYGAAIAVFVGCYIGWIGRISTGYGSLRSPHTQFFSTAASLADYVSRLNAQMHELVRNYWASGFVLVGALLVFMGASIGVARRGKAATPFPLNWFCLGLLALVFFLSNAGFHTPLGMEWQHRYSLKLYPLAFWVLWLGSAGLPIRWARLAGMGLALMVAASLFRQMQSFCGTMWLKDAGLFVWTDEQLVLEGMRSPFGLSVGMGAALFACGAAMLLADVGRRRRIIPWIGAFAVLSLPVLATYAPGHFLNRPDREGMNVQYYDDPNLEDASGACVETTLNVWNGSKRPLWNVNKREYSLAGTGWLFAPSAAQYDFFSESKDGVRLYLDGERVVDNWENRMWAGSGRHASRFLEKGFHAVRIEQCKHSGAGGFRVRWGGGGIAPNTIVREPYLQRRNGENAVRTPLE